MQCSLHYLSLKQSGYDESNTAVTFYHDRTHFNAQNENSYVKYTESYHASQGRSFMLHNRKAALPSKITMIKDKVREFDELLSRSAINGTNLNIAKHNDNFNNNKTAYAPIVKIIWISSSFIILVLQDAHLIWLNIDPVSCDILQLLIDKSLIQVNPQKLSGGILCDAILFLNSESTKVKIEHIDPKLILAYSDKSKLDIIGFAKPTNFLSHLNSNDVKLEKLQIFEPTISTIDFNCPTAYRIEKHLCLNHNSHYPLQSCQSFTLWWPNDGQIVWTPSTALNSLDKDDLNTNVIVINQILTQDAFIQCQFKSIGLLLKLEYLTEKNLIAIEQSESTTQQFVINIYRYELTNETSKPASTASMLSTVPILPSSSTTAPNPLATGAQYNYKHQIFTFNLNSKIKFISNLSASKRFVIMISTDLTVYICDINRKLAHKYRLLQLATNGAYQHQIFNSNIKAEWIYGDSIFCVYDINGKINFYDIAFNQIDFKYLNRSNNILHSLSEHLNMNVFDMTNNDFIKLSSFNNIYLDTLNICFCFNKGPFGVLHVLLPNKFNELTLVSSYLKCNLDNTMLMQSILKAVNLLNKLDWDSQGDICILCLTKILNFLLSEQIEFNQVQTLIEQALASFYTPQRPLQEKTIDNFKFFITRYARKFFYQLVRYENFDKAFLLAVDIGAKDLFNDLYYCAIDKHEMQLAEICRKKYKQMEHEEQLQQQQNHKILTKSFNSIKLGSDTDTDFYSQTDDNNDEFSTSDEPYSDDDSYSSSQNDDIQVSNLSMGKQIDKIFNESEIESINKNLIQQNEGLISNAKNSTITFYNFSF